MTLKQKWKKHLKENNMSYWEHWKFAVGHGLVCMKAGIYLCIHGMFPCFYRRAGTKLVRHLDRDFTEHRYDTDKQGELDEPN
ncbi:MAG: hypothetical protein CBC91_06820 [Rickettsiales bacterium TMED131]|nr:MAG: hypothetical protein CBC91_06820 [Rickettsiales bacterium TMED131]